MEPDNEKSGGFKERNLLAGTLKSTSEDEQELIEVLLERDMFFIKDNKVYLNIADENLRHKFMPVVNYLEMIRLAGERFKDQKVQIIKDLIMTRVILIPDEVSRVNINFTPYQDQMDKMKFGISSFYKGEELINAEGKIIYQADNLKKRNSNFTPIDIENIKERCNDYVSGEKYYNYLEENEYRVGSSLQAVEKFYYNEDNKEEAISKLKVPIQVQKEFENYMLHPSLMEGALQTLLGIKFQSPIAEESMNRTIFSFERVEIISPLERECYSYVKFSEDHFSSPNLNKYDMQITNEKGNPLIKINNICMREPYAWRK
jgi:hypothetical protein